MLFKPVRVSNVAGGLMTQGAWEAVAGMVIRVYLGVGEVLLPCGPIGPLHAGMVIMGPSAAGMTGPQRRGGAPAVAD